MYEKFFGFKEKPFSIIPDASYFYQSRQHRLALAQLEYGLLNRVGFIVISGNIGTGKTTLIRTLLAKLDRDINTATIFNTTVSPREFLDMVLREFGLEPGEGNLSDNLSTLKKYLTECHEKGTRSLLIIDEAQNLSIETLEEIRLLSNMEKDREYLLHIVLVGQTELREKLMHPALNQLAQRIAVHYNLASLSEEETESYIMYRLQVACRGEEPGVVFARDAVKAIYRHSNGIPRLINVLCDLCLVYAYADEQRGINLQTVDEVVKNQEASGFSSLFTARAAATPDTRGGNADIQEAGTTTSAFNGLKNDTLRILEAKVADLQNGLIAVNRTVQDFMLAHSEEIARAKEQREKVLNRTIEVQKVEIERLKTERKALLNRIYELSTQVKQKSRTEKQRDSAAQNGKKGGRDEQRDQRSHSGTPVSKKAGGQQAQKKNVAVKILLWGAAATAVLSAGVLMNTAWRAKLLNIVGSIPF